MGSLIRAEQILIEGGGNVASDAEVLAASGSLRLDIDQNTLNFSNSSGLFVKTASNLGAGSGLFVSKVADDLQFRSLIAGTNIGIQQTATALEIFSTAAGGGGETNTASNQGGAVGQVFLQKTSEDLEFRTIAPSSGINVINGASTITIDGAALQDQITSNDTDITTLQNTKVDTGANLGGAAGQPFSSIVGTTLNMRTIAAGTNIASIGQAGNVITINGGSITNLGGAQPVFSGDASNNHQLFTIADGSGTKVDLVSNTIRVNTAPQMETIQIQGMYTDGTTGMVSNVPSILMDSTTTTIASVMINAPDFSEGIQGQVLGAPDRLFVHIKLVSTGSVTFGGFNTVAFQGTLRSITQGTSLTAGGGTFSTGVQSLTPTGAWIANRVEDITLDWGANLNAIYNPGPLLLSLSRVGGNPADTLPVDINLIDVRLEWRYDN